MASPSLLLLLLALALPHSYGLLDEDFYRGSCPQMFNIVRSGLQQAILLNQRNAASVLRLFFHDCFVNGCDASVLLDDTPTMRGEKTASPNNSLRAYEVIDAIKLDLERECPGVVSCADTLAVAARDAVYLSGGPYWDVKLGRRDSLRAYYQAAGRAIPQPDFDLKHLLNSFTSVGLDAVDMVTLAGAHTIGYARCVSFESRLYNRSQESPPMNLILRQRLKRSCPRLNSRSLNQLQPLDSSTPSRFDNQYYSNLRLHGGLLRSDQELNTTQADSEPLIQHLASRFATDQEVWFTSFSESMIRMGNILPLLGSQSEVRRNCRRVNS